MLPVGGLLLAGKPALLVSGGPGALFRLRLATLWRLSRSGLLPLPVGVSCVLAGRGGARRSGSLLPLPGCGRMGLGVGEKVPPGTVDGVRIFEVALVHLLDQPLVRPESGPRRL